MFNFLKKLFGPGTDYKGLVQQGAVIVDVRSENEFKSGHIESAVNIPLNDLRSRMDELPKGPEIWAYCLVGQRSYYAARALSQHGFDAKNISGGYKTLQLLRDADGRLDQGKKRSD